MQLTRASAPRALGASMLVAALVPAFGNARAQQAGDRSAAASVSVYADDDHTTVISPAATVHVPLPSDFEAQAEVAVDQVTSASVDVVSQATPYAFSDTRVEGALAITASPIRDGRLTLRGLGSTENDYDSLTLSAAGELDLADRNTTLQLSYALGIDEVGLARDPTFSRDRRTHRVIGGLTQSLDARTFYDVLVDATFNDGYQCSAYRFVPVLGTSGQRLYSLAERIPGARAGAALVVRVRRAFGSAPYVFVHLEYRLYADSWGIGSHTVRLRGLLPVLAERLTLSAEARAYVQGAADFYRAAYVDDGSGAPGYRTRDRVLGRAYTFSGQLGGDLALGGTDARHPVLELYVAASVLRFGWPDFPLQHGRTALVTTAGANVPF